MRQVALVTGAARGIGRSIATVLAQDRALAITFRNSDPSELLNTHPETLAIKTDFTRPDSAQQVIDAVLTKYGRIDTLVLNAGAISADDTPDAGDVFQVNLLANDALLKAALPHLYPGACVIAISSVNALLPAMSAVLYSASKAALNTWVRGMAKNLGAKGIRVNAVAPGAINTPDAPRDAELTQQFVDNTALGRIGRPEDIANTVRFLASEGAAFITGEVLTVSGGYRL
ncbi:SDR family oxidoreductase [Sedimentitalea todarodis]|uniref:SDR family oxidoreductase n=2 Tax=Sedimentitalea todarodis TaxID=1631240 RepID=A0ABU3VCW7_9RHOB|nr:SDR family oxidoreductase [Sedimentitalea todarodis]